MEGPGWVAAEPAAPVANGVQPPEDAPEDPEPVLPDMVICQHERMAQWIWVNRGNMRCHLCHDLMRGYLFMCRNCRMRVCNGCRVNRFH